MALIAITDGVTVKTTIGTRYSIGHCIVSAQGRHSLTKREAMKLAKILTSYVSLADRKERVT